MTEQVTLREHPIMLTLQDAIAGNGFLAGITLSGRALVRKEDDGKWWMYGVRPAGIAQSGETIEETFSRFRNRYKEILIDIAQESNTFEELRAEVERFFSESDVDQEDAKLWEESLAIIRTKKCDPPAAFSSLPREVPESKPSQIMVGAFGRCNKEFRSERQCD